VNIVNSKVLNIYLIESLFDWIKIRGDIGIVEAGNDI